MAEAGRQKEMEYADVVIVGAGIAGFAAVKTLAAEAPHLRVCVLEARYRVGGRTLTTELAMPDGHLVPIDIGASWLHGGVDAGVSERHPLAVAAEGRATFKMTSSGNMWVCRDTHIEIATFSEPAGTFLSHAEGGALDTGIGPLMDEMLACCRANPSWSAGACAQACYNRFASRGEDPALLAGWRFVLRLHEIWLGLEMHEVPGLEWEDMATVERGWGDLEGGHYVAAGGLGHLMRALWGSAAGRHADVRLGCKVVGIARPSYAGISTRPSASDRSQRPANVVVEYDGSNGRQQTLSCGALICTIPVGCLQRSLHTMWTPKLSKVKQQAIARTQMTRYIKVVMVYDIAKPFWHDNVMWLGFLARDGGEAREDFHLFFSYWRLKHITVLVAYACGRLAEEVEALGEVKAGDRVTRTLRKMYGPRAVPQPWKVLISRWLQDEHSLGAYPLADEPTIAEIAEPSWDGTVKILQSTFLDWMPCFPQPGLLDSHSAYRFANP